MKKPLRRSISIGALFRHMFVGWFCAVLLEYLRLPSRLQSLDNLEGIAAASAPRLFLTTFVVAAIMCILSLLFPVERMERWSCAGLFTLLAAVTLTRNFNWALAGFFALVLVILLIYAIGGRKSDSKKSVPEIKSHWIFPLITGAVTAAVFWVICIWTVSRVQALLSPTYDFGIFSQMFYYMKETGLPMTTLERSTLLSHFAVHVSPIYYVMLPVYWLFPYPVTLQIMQAAVIVSAVIPMWLIGKQKGLSGLQRMLLCCLLLLIPSTAGGAYYDLHENCFLLPLILWLLYALDRKRPLLSILFGILTLCVKEDAAVYVAVIAIYGVVHGLIEHHQARRREVGLNLCLLALSLCWFALSTGYLANRGDGVMTSRYNNFDFAGDNSLITVVVAVLVCPMKMMYECTKDPDRLIYIAQTLIPLLGLPLLTRKYERYFLLIPYILVNLMPDWQYQYNIFYQYSFGSSALLLYLCAINLADIRWRTPRFAASVCAVALSCGFFFSLIVPPATTTRQFYQHRKTDYADIYQTLQQIPDDAIVTAHTFYTVPLSSRKFLYDLGYCSREQLLHSEYVVVCQTYEKDFHRQGLASFEKLDSLLQSHGFVELCTNGKMVIYQNTSFS